MSNADVIVTSAFVQDSCRYYQCYREYNTLVCKSLSNPDYPLRSPYQDIYCVKYNIPKEMDKWILFYQSIPKRVHIEK